MVRVFNETMETLPAHISHPLDLWQWQHLDKLLASEVQVLILACERCSPSDAFVFDVCKWYPARLRPLDSKGGTQRCQRQPPKDREKASLDSYNLSIFENALMTSGLQLAWHGIFGELQRRGKSQVEGYR